jgi:hypothetical protein
MRAALVMAAAALTGCSASEPKCGFVGDPNQPLELSVVVLGADLSPAPAGDGTRVALVKPPQGGRVIYAGARARNLETCMAAQVVSALRDPNTHAVLGLEGRPVVLAAAGDGWAAVLEQQPSSYANVAVCPNQRSSRDIDEEPYELFMKLTDAGGRTAEVDLEVVPFCAEPDNLDECQCICKAGYVLGASCGAPDAGS